jgi:ornithine decarboxylase
MNTGAYTIEYASPHFNGITPPEIFTIEELQEEVDKKLILMAQQ